MGNLGFRQSAVSLEVLALGVLDGDRELGVLASSRCSVRGGHRLRDGQLARLGLGLIRNLSFRGIDFRADHAIELILVLGNGNGDGCLWCYRSEVVIAEAILGQCVHNSPHASALIRGGHGRIAILNELCQRGIALGNVLINQRSLIARKLVLCAQYILERVRGLEGYLLA